MAGEQHTVEIVGLALEPVGNTSMIEGTRVSSPASILTRMRVFSTGDSRWYTTSNRRSRAGQSTAVTSMKLINRQRSSSRRNAMTLTMSRAFAVTVNSPCATQWPVTEPDSAPAMVSPSFSSISSMSDRSISAESKPMGVPAELGYR
jgi:hypothetical protein